ncbi:MULTISPECIES: NAD(P)-dependent oxidoreductase [Brevibacterium]|uniref:NAD(P)-dependent oxidoreductase n=1 Tax=Brevibacterium TaxID=1696 RepID=UPI00194FFFB1|nr:MULTISPECIES: NAD(P)-dependent oxidoreductase [Brevibacterium]MBM6588935.1 NAD(P)-dependent oxidoreductase [Brevibacterium sp. RIT 803]
MSATTSQGLVGLGQMGLTICQRMAAAAEVIAFDISVERRALADSIESTTTTDELRRIADCSRIILSLPTPAISRAVVGELAPHLDSGTIIIETSTVLPSDVRRLAKIVEPYGARVFDAAILSGVSQMSSGSATILLGGPIDVIDEVTDILSAIGPGGTQHFGPIGSGMAAKVVNNGVAHAVMVVLTEAFAMARSQDIDLAQITEMLMQADGGLKRPLEHRIADRVARGDFAGGMPLDAARKDSTLALALAQEGGVPLFATQAAHTVYELAMADELGREDYASVAMLWEKWTDRDLRFGDDQS